MEDDEEVMIEMEFPLSSLRLMHLCVSRAYQNWPGGDPLNRSRSNSSNRPFMWRCIPRFTRSTRFRQKKTPDESGFVRGAFYLGTFYQPLRFTVQSRPGLCC